jgi:hypothetical protein
MRKKKDFMGFLHFQKLDRNDLLGPKAPGWLELALFLMYFIVFFCGYHAFS